MEGIEKKGVVITTEKAEIQIDSIAEDLDGGAVFLRQNGFSAERIQELLANKERNKKLVRKVWISSSCHSSPEPLFAQRNQDSTPNLALIGRNWNLEF